MPLKLLTWNIEQYGKTRALKDEAALRNEYVVKVINDLNPDIVSIIEAKTTDPDVASKIAMLLCDALLKVYSKKYSFTYTYHNSMEIYIYLYKYEVVTPVVLASGKDEVYTKDELEKQNFTLVKDPLKDFTKNTFNGLTHYFPLIGYETDLGRPLGLGLFYYPQEQKYFCFMAWHNRAGKQFKNKSSSDTIPKEEMKLLADADYIKDADKGFTLKIGNKKEKVHNILVSGDFNVDMVKNKNNYLDFFKFFATNQDKTYLHKYDPEKQYNNSGELRTVNFDNFLAHCPEFKSGKASVADIPEWIFQKHHADLIKKTGLSDQSLFLEGVVAEAWEQFDKQTNNTDFGIFDKELWPGIKDNLRSLQIRNNKVDTGSLKAVEDIYNEYNCDDLFDELVKKINTRIESLAEVYIHYKKVIDGNVTIRYSDTLFLTLNILSDHLPVQLEIK